jgi:hypothetical protein
LNVPASVRRLGSCCQWFVASHPIALRDGLRDIRAVLAGAFQRLSFDLRKL